MIEEFYTIVARTKTGRKIYFGAEDEGGYSWKFCRSDAIWFESREQAENFAENYFTVFKDYSIEPLSFDINTLQYATNN